MSRKDYQILASAIKSEVEGAKPAARRVIAALAKNLCVALALDNGRFSPEKFLAACGL